MPGYRSLNIFAVALAATVAFGTQSSDAGGGGSVSVSSGGSGFVSGGSTSGGGVSTGSGSHGGAGGSSNSSSGSSASSGNYAPPVDHAEGTYGASHMTPGGSQWNASVDAQWNAVSHPHNVPPNYVPNGAGDIYFSWVNYQFHPGKPNNDKDASGWDPVKWAYSESEAAKHAKDYNQPYAIFFCSEFTSRLAGEGYEAYMRFRNENAGALPQLTVVDYTAVLENFKSAGIELFVKVPEGREYTELFNRYDAAPGTLIICAPNGEKLATFAGTNCNPIKVGEFLVGGYDQKMGTWEDNNKSKDEATAWHDLQKARRICTGVIASVTDSRLDHLVCFGKKITTGSCPDSEAAFQALTNMGVRTIIRIDGEPPDTTRADKLGMICVHLPLSFSGISSDQARAIAKAVRDLPGPIYIHGSSFDVRAPAAAAAACIVLGDMSKEQAAAALAIAGAPTGYSGLYASIENITPLPAEKLGSVEFNFTAKTNVGHLAAAMTAIEKTWLRIESAQGLHWKSPDARKDLNVDKDALELIDRFVAAGSLDQLKNLPNSSELRAETQTSLSQLVHQWQSGHSTPAEIEKLDSAFKRAATSCMSCHEQYRNK